MPKITGVTEGTIVTTALGDLVQAGLPNITGELFSQNATGEWGLISNNGANYFNTQGGVFQTDGNGTYAQSVTRGTQESSGRLTFDASRSSSIYGNSTTVQPQSIKVLYYIVIATSTKTDIEVDIDEVMTDLNGKVDKADLTTCHVVVETYANGKDWYRVWDDGWCEQGGQVDYSITGAGFNTVTYLKPFLNEPNVVVTQKGSYYNSSYSGQHTDNVQVSTATYCTIYVDSNIPYRNWQACGYIS